MVPVDEKIKPLKNAIVWLDGRSYREAVEISNEFYEDKIFEITGLPDSDPSWPTSIKDKMVTKK
jgi:sugar (pentulose or hexulose) kinase